jgi:hypothetical protein
VELSNAWSPATHKAATFAWVRRVYIRSGGAFFPNDPVPNHEIEQRIGTIHSNRISPPMGSRIDIMP